MNDEARSQVSEAYEMVSHSEAASPVSNVALAEARADDVFRHFFEDGHDDEGADNKKQAAGQQTSFFDEMLSECVADEAERKRLYPSMANRRLLLTTIYSSEALNRIQADALVLFIVLRHGGLANARRFSRATRLPGHVLRRIRAFHHLDQGHYLQGVSLLPQADLQDPSQTAKILSLLNPLRGNSSTQGDEEEEGKALAMDQLLSSMDPETISLALEEETSDMDESTFAQARILSLCHAHGIVEAWNAVLRDETLLVVKGEEEVIERTSIRSACISALVGFCLVPTPKSRAVDALISMPLSLNEDDEVAEVLLAAASPAQVQVLSDSARDTALELLVVRRIASGRYMDAIRLLGRIDREAATKTSADPDEGLRRRQQLRQKRQALLAACKASLTHVERSLLAVEGVVAMEESTSEKQQHQDGGDVQMMAMSWEDVIPSEQEASQPLTASPAVRASPMRQSLSGSANDSQSALLAAVVRASSSPRSSSNSPSQASPQSAFRKSSSNVASPSAAASPLRAKSRLAFLRQSSSSSSSHSNPPSPQTAKPASPLLRAGQRPYALYNDEASVASPSPSAAPATYDPVEPVKEQEEEAAAAAMDSPLAGPYARLARQLQAQGAPHSPSELLKPMLSSTRGASGGNRAAAAARRRSASMDVDDGEAQGVDETSRREEQQGSPLMQKPIRRYEPTYKMSGKGRQRRAQSQHDEEEEREEQQQQVQESSPSKAKRTRRTRTAAASASTSTPARRTKPNEKKRMEKEEEKVKEEEEDQVMDLEEPKRRGKSTKKKASSTTTTTPKAKEREQAALPRRSSRLSSVEPTISTSNTVPEMRDLGMPASLSTKSRASGANTGTRTRTRTRSASPTKKDAQQQLNESEEDEVPKRRTTRTRASKLNMPGAF